MYLAVKRGMSNVTRNKPKTIKTAPLNSPIGLGKLKLTKPRALGRTTTPFINLLGCRLSRSSVDQSLDQQRRTNSTILIAVTLMIVGAFITVTMVILAAISSITVSSDIPNSGVNWFHRSFSTTGIPAALVLGGFLLFRRERSRMIRPIYELEYGGFETLAMKREFEDFRRWGRESLPDMGFRLPNNRYLRLPDYIWDRADLAVILFGSEAHRRSILDARNLALSSLEIHERDWSAYSASQPKSENLAAPEPNTREKVALKNRSEARKPKKPESFQDTQDTKSPENTLSLRQLKEGEWSKWCPRLEMFCSNADYFQQYKDRELNINSIGVRRQSCHRVLLYFANNPENVKIFFQRDCIEPAQIGRATKIDNQVKKELRVQGKNVSSAFNNLKKMRWPVMEKHIEGTALIPDHTLIQTYPELKSYWESRKTI